MPIRDIEDKKTDKDMRMANQKKSIRCDRHHWALTILTSIRLAYKYDPKIRQKLARVLEIWVETVESQSPLDKVLDWQGRSKCQMAEYRRKHPRSRPSYSA